MAQETLNGIVALIFTLSVQEQEYIIEQMQIHLKQQAGLNDLIPYSTEEIDARIDESERQIVEGKYKPLSQILYPNQVAV